MSTNSPELSRQMSDSGLATVGTSTEIQGLQRKVERMVREDSNPPTPPADTKDRPEIAEPWLKCCRGTHGHHMSGQPPSGRL